MRIQVLLLMLLFAWTLQAQVTKVQLQYNVEDVNVVLNDDFIGNSPDFVKVDFSLAGRLQFFKQGYYTKSIEIDPDIPFNHVKLILVKKPSDYKLSSKRLLNLDTLLVSDIVTNFTESDLKEVISKNFIRNNFLVGRENTKLFPGAESELQNCRYKIAIEIMHSNQVRHVYRAPRFLMATIEIRWSLLDKETNKVVYHESTEGNNFIRIQKVKGMVISDVMQRVMLGAIKESQLKLFTDDQFRNLIEENNY